MQLFMRMGIPKVVTSDQGTEFNNQLNEEFMRLLNIDHRLSTPYHPQVSAEAEWEDLIELFCICPMPEIPPMVECSRCIVTGSYHVSCVSVPQEALDDSNIGFVKTVS